MSRVTRRAILSSVVRFVTRDTSGVNRTRVVGTCQSQLGEDCHVPEISFNRCSPEHDDGDTGNHQGCDDETPDHMPSSSRPPLPGPPDSTREDSRHRCRRGLQCRPSDRSHSLSFNSATAWQSYRFVAAATKRGGREAGMASIDKTGILELIRPVRGPALGIRRPVVTRRCTYERLGPRLSTSQRSATFVPVGPVTTRSSVTAR